MTNLPFNSDPFHPADDPDFPEYPLAYSAEEHGCPCRLLVRDEKVDR